MCFFALLQIVDNFTGALIWTVNKCNDKMPEKPVPACTHSCPWHQPAAGNIWPVAWSSGNSPRWARWGWCGYDSECPELRSPDPAGHDGLENTEDTIKKLLKFKNLSLHLFTSNLSVLNDGRGGGVDSQHGVIIVGIMLRVCLVCCHYGCRERRSKVISRTVVCVKCHC